jgi:hypothetical protein
MGQPTCHWCTRTRHCCCPMLRKAVQVGQHVCCTQLICCAKTCSTERYAQPARLKSQQRWVQTSRSRCAVLLLYCWRVAVQLSRTRLCTK